MKVNSSPPGMSCVATRQRLPAGGSNRTSIGAFVEPDRPQDGGGHVDVRVRGIHGEIGAVETVAEHPVGHFHGAAVARHRPLLRPRALQRQSAARAVAGAEVEHVLRELVQGVAARRRTAHVQPERSRGHVGERDGHVHQPVLALRKRQAIADRRGGGGCGLRDRQRGVQDQRPGAGQAPCGQGERTPHPSMIPQSSRAAKRSPANCVQPVVAPGPLHCPRVIVRGSRSLDPPRNDHI